MSAYRSKQTRELQRHLTVRLLVGWIAYTAIFAVVALVLNATVVRGLANEVANVTAPWTYWSFDAHSVDDCLRLLGCDVVDMAVDEESVARARAEVAEAEGAEGSSAVIESSDASSEVAPSFSIATEGDVPIGDLDDEAYADAMVLLLAERNAEGADGGARRWMTVGELKREALHQAATMTFGWGSAVEIQDGIDFVAARDLTAYRNLRAMKLPLALGLYLVGCVVLALAALRRALRSFDDLAGAVGDLVADRERPVKLPSSLAITQDELNAVRLSSLADERAAVAAERRKDELVAYLAHDIKTPLTSVVGYLELLDEAPDLPEATRRRYIRLAFEKAERFGGLIDEFFEITRYNLQSIPLERRTVEARLFLEQVAEELYPAAEERGVAIVADAPVDASLLIDPDKMARAVGNVLRNAVAFADEGTTIELVARRRSVEAEAAASSPTAPTEDAVGEVPSLPLAIRADKVASEPSSAASVSAYWEISVTNQGREISAAHLQSIFDKFYREDAARATQKGGAGLGLAIAKEIVIAHGGTIAAASDQGRTTFAISLPDGRGILGLEAKGQATEG